MDYKIKFPGAWEAVEKHFNEALQEIIVCEAINILRDLVDSGDIIKIFKDNYAMVPDEIVKQILVSYGSTRGEACKKLDDVRMRDVHNLALHIAEQYDKVLVDQAFKAMYRRYGVDGFTDLRAQDYQHCYNALKSLDKFLATLSQERDAYGSR